MTARLLLACTFAAAVAAADPAAHDPQYGQPGLWPEDVQKSAYARETWPVAPLFTWTVTGNAKEKGGKETDPRETANWSVDGKPATRPPGAEDDVLFPTGSVIRMKEEVALPCRHLTVGRGVRLVKAVGPKPTGNVWVQETGAIETGFLQFAGPKHTFVRNDNRDFRSSQAGMANKIIVNKPGASLEIVGTVKTWDEMGFVAGTIIVGPDAELVPGNRSVQPIYPEATLVLLSGATYHKRGNQPYNTDLVVSGTLLAGTPERPLTRDCRLGLSFKTKGRSGVVDNPHPGTGDDYGMVVNPQGTLRVHSADPQRARLAIAWNGLSSMMSKNAHDPDPQRRRIDLVLQGTIALDGVRFDDIRAGGILIADRAMRDRGDLAYGEHNEGPADQLFTVLDAPIEAKLLLSIGSPDFVQPTGGKGK